MKHLLTTVVALALCITTGAQNSKQGSTEFKFNAGYGIALNEGTSGMIFLQPEFGKNFTEQFYLGIGTGYVTNDEFEAHFIPAFLRAEMTFSSNKVKPYASLQIGYDINVDGGDGNFRLNPEFGVQLPLTNTVGFNLGSSDISSDNVGIFS